MGLTTFVFQAINCWPYLYFSCPVLGQEMSSGWFWVRVRGTLVALDSATVLYCDVSVQMWNWHSGALLAPCRGGACRGHSLTSGVLSAPLFVIFLQLFQWTGREAVSTECTLSSCKYFKPKLRTSPTHICVSPPQSPFSAMLAPTLHPHQPGQHEGCRNWPENWPL